MPSRALALLLLSALALSSFATDYPGTCTPKHGGGPAAPACGYSCDSACNCARCNTKPGCMTEGQCLGTCNSGGNAKWCGAAPVPPPPAPPVPPPGPPPNWTTAGNMLQRDGAGVVLRGIGTTCTEYFARGVGMHCWVNYDFAHPDAAFALDVRQVYPLVDILRAVASDAVVPSVRIPLTASSWLGIETNASRSNAQKYPNLDGQYRELIADLVNEFTRYNVATILDLHWSDDDTDNAPMASKICVNFWTSVAEMFGNNSFVFYELYNEPHAVEEAVWAHGDESHSGMLEMLAAVRAHTESPVIIAGAGGYAYDSASLIALDAELLKADHKNVLFNFHPYMGPNQAGDDKKCPRNFEQYVEEVRNSTERPVIITEFGQSCQPTSGAAEHCEGTYDGVEMGYDEAILTIAAKQNISWLPWAWRPMATGPNNKTCQDVNGGADPAGLSLAQPGDGRGANFAALWRDFASK